MLILLGYCTPIPMEADLRPDPEILKLWDERAAAYDRLCHAQGLFTLLSNRLIDMLPADLQGAVLDIGAGSGLTSELLLARHPQCEAILLDPVEAMIALARRNLAGQRAQFRVALIEEAPALGICAVAAIASVSMQYLELEATFNALERVVEPGGRFAFNLWYHHWEETATLSGMAGWHGIAQSVCDAEGVAGLAAPVPPKSPPKTREQLMSASQRHGFRLVAEHRDQDPSAVTWGIEFMAMNPEWPVKGLEPVAREELLSAMREMAAGTTEPVVSTRFAFERMA